MDVKPPATAQSHTRQRQASGALFPALALVGALALLVGGAVLLRELSQPSSAVYDLLERVLWGEFSDPRAPVEARVGQEFLLSLEANRSTGYEWRLVEPVDAGALELLGAAYETSPRALSGAVGGGGRQVFRFRALRPGEAEVWLRHASYLRGGSDPAYVPQGPPPTRFRILVR